LKNQVIAILHAIQITNPKWYVNIWLITKLPKRKTITLFAWIKCFSAYL
jgi:hypothetical protein